MNDGLRPCKFCGASPGEGFTKDNALYCIRCESEKCMVRPCIAGDDFDDVRLAWNNAQYAIFSQIDLYCVEGA